MDNEFDRTNYQQENDQPIPVARVAPADDALREGIWTPDQSVKGVDLPFLKLGSTGKGLGFGLNLGIVNFGVQLGPELSATAGANVLLAKGQGGFGLGINEHGLHANGLGEAEVLGTFAGYGGAGGRLGNRVGLNVAARGFAGPASAGGDGHAYLSNSGLDVAANGGADLLVAGANGGGRFAIGQNSELRGGAGAHLGDVSIGGAAGIYSDQNTAVRPNLHVDASMSGRTASWDAQPPRILNGTAEPIKQAVEVRALPEPYSPQAWNKYHDQAMQYYLNGTVVVVGPTDKTWLDVARKIHPEADSKTLHDEAKRIHELNRPAHLRTGLSVLTMSAGQAAELARQAANEHFGLSV